MSQGVTINGSATGIIALTLNDLAKVADITLPSEWTKEGSISITDLTSSLDTGTGDYTIMATVGLQLEAPGWVGVQMKDVVVSLKATAPSSGTGGGAGGGTTALLSAAPSLTYDFTFAGSIVFTDKTNSDTFNIAVKGSYDSGSDTWSITATAEGLGTLDKVLNTLVSDVALSSLDFISSPADIDIQKIVLSGSHSGTGDTAKVDYSATVDFSLDIDLLGDSSLNLPVNDASITISDDSGTKSAKLKGTTIIPILNTAVEVELDLTAGGDDSISIIWEGITGTYTRTSSGDQTMSLIAKNWSVGKVLVSLAKTIGYENFQLESPWDVLNDVVIQEIEIIYDFTNKNISLSCDFASSIDLVFINVNGFTLERKNIGTKKAPAYDVLMTLNGSAIDDLSSLPGWNDILTPSSGGSGNGQSINNMPSSPGKGNKFFDLEYLGLGQRVSVTDPSDIDTVEQAIATLKTAFQKPSDASPMGTGSLQFDANSSWLIGTQVTLLEALELGFVFNDPVLYGLLINVNTKGTSKILKALAGLKFEILYKKINNSIGMYYIELTLPTLYRHLQFGEVAVTLPDLSLNIYTNGNFKVDVGYPVSMTNFSNCLTIQAFPFTGSGGFYFAVLDGATAKNLPATTTGAFHPVIEFGFAMNLGLGKSIHKGILKAGISVVALGALQGTLAWFHPAKDQSNSDLFYRLQGTFGLLGKVYGTINFVVVQANVNLMVTARATTMLESYKAIPLNMTAEVEAHAEISIDCGFFTIHIGFGFSTSISENMTVGSNASASEVPWSSSFGQVAPPEYFTALDAAATAGNVAIQPNWSNFAAPTGTPEDLQFYFVPQLTFTSDTDPEYVAMLHMDAPGSAAFYERHSHITKPTAGSTSFEKLSGAVLLWVVNSMRAVSGQTLADTATTAITISELQQYLSVLKTSDQLFTVPDIINFLQTQFTLNIANPPTSGSNTAGYTSIFPMFPGFTMQYEYKSSPGLISGGNLTFDTHATATPNYLQDIQNYLADLATAYEKNVGQPADTGGYSATANASIASFVFQDYFLMLAKSVVQDAIDYMKTYKKTWTSEAVPNLTTIASNFAVISTENVIEPVQVAQQNGAVPLSDSIALALNGCTLPATDNETVSGVCSYLDVNEAEFLEANLLLPQLFPATTVFNFTYQQTAQPAYTVASGDTLHTVIKHFETAIGSGVKITPAALMAQNVTAVLNTAIPLAVPTLLYHTKAADTLAGISTAFLTTRVITGDTAALVGSADGATQLLQTNSLTAGIFVPGTVITVNTKAYTVLEGDTVQTILAGLNAAGAACALSDLPTGTAALPGTAGTAPALSAAACLSPNTTLMMPVINYTTGSATTATLTGIANAYNLTVADIALTNEGVAGLWPENKAIAIPNLVALDASTVVTGMYRNDMLVNAAGLGSRIFLGGLQLPHTSNLTINNPNRITGGGVAAVEAPAAPAQYGLYALTGQQYPIDPKQGFTTNLTPVGVTMNIGDTLNPLHESLLDRVEEGVKHLLHHEQAETAQSTTSLTAVLSQTQLTDITNKQTALKTLSFGETVSLVDPVKHVDAHYSLSTMLPWKYPGAALSGLSSDTQLTIVPLSTHVMNDIAAQGTTPTMTFSLNRVDQENPVYNPKVGVITDMLWATRLKMEIKKLPSSPMAKGACYELIGLDPEDLLLLEPLCPPTDASFITGIHALYRPLTQSKSPEGYESTSLANQQLLITQADLSVYGDGTMGMQHVTAVNPVGLAIPQPNFLQLLLQASTERNGGYYLYFNDAATGSGFPASIFNQKDVGEIELMITYNYAASVVVPSNVNTIVANLPSTTKNTSLVLESTQLKTPVSMVPVGNYGFEITRPNPLTIASPEAPTADQLYLLQNFSQLSYVLSGTNFNTSNSGMPLSPKKQAGAFDNSVWSYEHVFPLYRFSTRSYDGLSNQPTGIIPKANPYLGMGDTATVDFHWVDLYGNNLSSPAPASLAITVEYRDEIIGFNQLPGLSITYLISTQAIQLNFVFATESYGVGGTAAEIAAGIAKAKKDLYTYTQSFYQMQTLFSANKSTVPVSLGCSIDESIGQTTHAISASDVNLIYTNAIDYLQGVIKSSSPAAVAPWTSSAIAMTMTNTEAIFELRAEIVIQRDPSLIDSNFTGAQHVQSRTQKLKPDVTPATQGDPHSLKNFASAVEHSYNSSTALFKVAVGDDSTAMNGTTPEKKIWVVQFGSSGISVNFASGATYYAPAPLATSVQNFDGVQITDYKTGKSLTKNFASVNLDKWSRTVLTAIDEVLLPEYAVPASIIGNAATSSADQVYEQILAAKKSIAGSISMGVSSIQSDGAALSQDGSTAFTDQLEQKLSIAYDVEAIVETPLSLKVGGTTPPTVTLYGKPVVGDGTASNYSLTGGDIVTTMTHLTSFLSLKGHGAEKTSMSLSNVTYHISHIGHQATGSLLSFVLPLTSLDINASGLGNNTLLNASGSLDIPLLLRAYPTPPSLLGQTFVPEPVPSSGATFADLLNWDYEFTYSLVAAEQDEVSVQVNYNAQDPAPGTGTTAPTAGAFETSLASFIHNYPEVKADLLANLPKVYFGMAETDAAYTTAKNALAAFATMVTNIATGWKTWVEMKGDGQGQTASDIFLVKESSVAGGKLVVKVTPSSANPNATSPTVQIPESGYVPEIVKNAWTGSFVKSDDPSTYLMYDHRNQYPLRTMTFSGLPLLTIQGAWAGAQIVRNSDLFQSPATTNDAFIFQSPVVKQKNVLDPLLERSSRYSLVDLGLTGTDVTSWLNAILKQFFPATNPPANVYLRFQIDYRYTQTSDATGPQITLPMALTTLHAFPNPQSAVDANLTKLGSYIATQVTGKNLQADTVAGATAGPYHYNGELNIGLTVYSNQNNYTPIAELKNLYIPVASITNWTS